MIRTKLASMLKFGASHHPLKGRIYPVRLRLKSRKVEVGKFLLGDVHGVKADHYARIVGRPLRPSTPVERFPHVKLLQQYLEIRDRLFEPETFEQTAYYQNARESLDIMGNYFEARRPEQIVDVGRRLVDRYLAISNSPRADEWGLNIRSTPPFPIRARRIRYSDCYQVIDGHHRLSTCYVLGRQEVLTTNESSAVLTPLQSLLLDVLWMKGSPRLYQPLDSPEVRTWPLVRRCTDRLAKIRLFLEEQRLLPPVAETYLDVGSSYGWFVDQMGRLGLRSFGVERDPIAASVGTLAYGLDPGQVFRSDIRRFFLENHDVVDIVTCFSVLHHYAIGNGNMSPEELIRMLDRTTGKVLFFDTGQNHEEWFAGRLPDWDADYIEGWIKANTSFRCVRRLGTDQDSVPPNERNYSRMLFACLR